MIPRSIWGPSVPSPPASRCARLQRAAQADVRSTRLGYLDLGRRPRRALVETHDEVRSQSLLLGDGPLRGEDVLRSVIDGAEVHACVPDARRVPQTEDLVPPAVGEDADHPTA